MCLLNNTMVILHASPAIFRSGAQSVDIVPDPARSHPKRVTPDLSTGHVLPLQTGICTSRPWCWARCEYANLGRPTWLYVASLKTDMVIRSRRSEQIPSNSWEYASYAAVDDNQSNHIGVKFTTLNPVRLHVRVALWLAAVAGE